MVKPISSAPVNISQSNVGYYKPSDAELEKDQDKLLKNTPITQARIFYDKFMNACTVYPAKGLTGNKNCNFYEFLTMGMVPYAIGSAMLIAMFNGATGFFNNHDAKFAKPIGLKMALGVIFYAIGKKISKQFVNTPVRLATGIDLDLPVEVVVKELPEPGNNEPRKIEYHTVYESGQFPRMYLLTNKKGTIKETNKYYDKIARKMGYDSNLTDSDQLLRPKIIGVVTKAKTVTYITQSLWAALGVLVAAQSPWENLFNKKQYDPWMIGAKGADGATKILESTKLTLLNSTRKLKEGTGRFIKLFGQSAKELYKGGANPSRLSGILSKTIIFGTVGLTALGTILSIYNFKGVGSKASASVIDKNKEYVVS